MVAVSSIIFIAVIVVIIFLIFKLIKKVIAALFTVLFFVLIILAGMVGLVYYDYNYLVGQQNYDVGLAYVEDDNIVYGFSFPIENGSADAQAFTGLDSSLNVEALQEGLFVITIEEQLFNDLLQRNEEYTLETGIPSLDVTLTSDEVEELFNDNDPTSALVRKMTETVPAEVKVATQLQVQQTLAAYLEEQQIEIEDALFALVMLESISDQKNVLRITQGFKSDELSIYPERFSFTFLKWFLPTNLISDLLKSSEEEE